jgi:hypothetical protein
LSNHAPFFINASRKSSKRQQRYSLLLLNAFRKQCAMRNI